MKAFVSKELRYPPEAAQANVEGTVVVRCSIAHTGTVSRADAISGPGYGCEEEACRIVSQMKFKVPKQPGKGKIIFHKTIKIHFRLPNPQQPEAPSATTFQYQYQPTATRSGQPKPDTGYEYTIDLPS